MKIKTAILIHFVLVVLLMVTFGMINWRLLNEVNRTIRHNRLIDQVVSRSFELNLITYDYLLNRSERAKEQWYINHSALHKLLQPTEIPIETNLQLNKIYKNHQSMLKVFSLLAGEKESGPREKTRKGWNREFNDRLSIQLILKSQVILSMASQLKHIYSDKLAQASRSITIAVSITVPAILLLTLYLFVFIRKILVKPIEQLHKGAEIIGQGNLGHQVEVKSSNEIGKLGQMLNSMTSNLSNITVSRDELNQEVIMRKQIEEQLKVSLKEKETLLQEIHHRVKNNMNVISSLLKLHENSATDEQVKDALKESQGRVYAMSTVHETLYNSKNLADINLSDYLSKMTNTLIQTYTVNPGKIKLVTNVDSIKIHIEKASPLGLIVNELISNALKYAFPDNRSGEIALKARKVGDQLELVVKDNGVGIQEEYDWRNCNTLGLKLVTNLVENQLGGSIELDVTDGTNFTILFNPDSY